MFCCSNFHNLHIYNMNIVFTADNRNTSEPREILKLEMKGAASAFLRPDRRTQPRPRGGTSSPSAREPAGRRLLADRTAGSDAGRSAASLGAVSHSPNAPRPRPPPSPPRPPLTKENDVMEARKRG